MTDKSDTTEFDRLVNMTGKRHEEWLNTEESKRVGYKKIATSRLGTDQSERLLLYSTKLKQT